MKWSISFNSVFFIGETPWNLYHTRCLRGFYFPVPGYLPPFGNLFRVPSFIIVLFNHGFYVVDVQVFVLQDKCSFSTGPCFSSGRFWDPVVSIPSTNYHNVTCLHSQLIRRLKTTLGWVLLGGRLSDPRNLEIVMKVYVCSFPSQ